MTEYQRLLLEFRQRMLDLCWTSDRLRAVSHQIDPGGSAPDDPMATSIFAECTDQLRAACAASPGLRQLLAAALLTTGSTREG